MDCPHCTSTVTKERTKKTSLGYRTFCCSDCKRTFNERTETPFNFLEYPTDSVLLVVLWRVGDKFNVGGLGRIGVGGGVLFFAAARTGAFSPVVPPLVRELHGARRRRSMRASQRA